MNSKLTRRLMALERAAAARGLVLRVYASEADAAADSEPSRPGVTVMGIITGVPRAPGASAP